MMKTKDLVESMDSFTRHYQYQCAERPERILEYTFIRSIDNYRFDRLKFLGNWGKAWSTILVGLLTK